MIILRRCTNEPKINQFVSSLRKLSTSTLPKEEKIKLGKYEINYLKVGEGAHNVLCLPGALGTIWTDFKPQIEGFDRQKFTVVTWDPPGYGKSRPPDKDFPTDFYEKDAAMATEFMKALNISKYSILGWSDGAVVGIIQAARTPEAVQKLVIWGCNSYILPKEIEWYKRGKDISKWSPGMREPLVKVYGEEFVARTWAKLCDGMEALFHANKGDICSPLLKHIKCPTFILYGEKDVLVDKEHLAHLHSNILNSRIHLYPEGKHNIHLNKTRPIATRVIKRAINAITIMC